MKSLGWVLWTRRFSTGFFGRISLIIDLGPLSIAESGALLKAIHFKGSDQEIYELLAVLGGIPWYLEQVAPRLMAKENIRKLCFQPESILSKELDHIFHDLFDDRGGVYQSIIRILPSGMKMLSDIRRIIRYSHSGTLSKILKHLITAGFVSEHHQWSLKTGAKGKQSLYRLSDPFLRFYLKYIEPVRDQIDKKQFKNVPLEQLLNWDTIIGLQIETLLLQNRTELLQAIGVNFTEVINDNPFIQKATVARKGCQIDYLVQTKTKNIYVCEFKFQSKELSTKIIEEMKVKINNLEVPRNFAIVPVLFHLNGVSEAVQESNYFYRIVDITNFLNNRPS